MNFVKVQKEKKDDTMPPPPDLIKRVVESQGCTNVTATQESARSVKVEYDGVLNHNTFPAALKAANNNTGKWTFVWGDSSERTTLALAGSLGTQYSIAIHNRSEVNDMKAIVFQQSPGLPRDVVSLAWLAKTCHKHTDVTFTWTLDYNFVWGQTGTLKPGVNYDAGGTLPADLTTNNLVTLSYVDDGFEFSPTSAGGAAGSLFIIEADDVPGAGNPKQGCVGIGMHGKGTFVKPTQSTGAGGLQFEVDPEYWIALGNYDEGEVVKESVLYHPVKVEFSGGLFNADCAFDGTGWTIKYS